MLGKHSTFILKHGENQRIFRDVVVSRPVVAARDDNGRPVVLNGQKVMVEHPETDRYELTGVEVFPPDRFFPRGREMRVTVGFLTSHVKDAD